MIIHIRSRLGEVNVICVSDLHKYLIKLAFLEQRYHLSARLSSTKSNM